MLWLMLAAAFCAVTVLSYGRSANSRLAFEQDAYADEPSELARGVPRHVLSIVGIAFALRLFLGLLLNYYGWDHLLAPDTQYYTEYGTLVARFWTATGHFEMGTLWHDGQSRFVLLNALIQYFFNKGQLIMLVLTSLAGAWAVLLAWRIARHLSDTEAAHRVLLLTTFFPSLVLWSSLTLRDPFMVLAVTGAVWAAIQLKEAWYTGAAVRLITWCLIIGLFRDYLLLLVAVAAVIAFLGGARMHIGRDVVVGAIAFAAIAFLILKLRLGYDQLGRLNFGAVYQMRANMLWKASSAYLTGANPSSLEGALGVLPMGVLYFLYGPLPWKAQGMLQMLTVPEMLFWYWLTPRIWRGIRLGWRTNLPTTWTMGSMAIVLILAYGLVSGNVGTAYRHRAQVLPILLIFAGVGWSVSARANTARIQADAHREVA